jgi:hypothetical protein
VKFIRPLPWVIAAFILGALSQDSAFGQQAAKAKGAEVVIVIGAALLAWLLLCAMTRGAGQQAQSGPSYGQAAPRTRRFGRN